jgi:DNA-directed RNA polymerase subunit RPC12/RpoP
VLIFGLSVSEDLLSTLIYTCETCGNSAAHRLIKRTRKFSFFFIPLFPVGTTYIDTCAACGRSVEVSRGRAEAAARQTGPELR